MGGGRRKTGVIEFAHVRPTYSCSVALEAMVTCYVGKLLAVREGKYTGDDEGRRGADKLDIGRSVVARESI